MLIKIKVVVYNNNNNNNSFVRKIFIINNPPPPITGIQVTSLVWYVVQNSCWSE